MKKSNNNNINNKLLLGFEIQTDHLILARRPDRIIINKKERTCRTVDFTVPADHRVKKNKYLDLATELKKSDDYTNCNRCSWYSHKWIGTTLEDLEITGRVETVQTTALLRSARIL